MTQTTPSADQHQFVQASPWKRVFRIIRWTTYTFALVTLVLLLHKAPPPLVETSPQAAARVEEKFGQVEKAVASGQPATLRMDETELNSYLASHLTLADKARRIRPLQEARKMLPAARPRRPRKSSRCVRTSET